MLEEPSSSQVETIGREQPGGPSGNRIEAPESAEQREREDSPPGGTTSSAASPSTSSQSRPGSPSQSLLRRDPHAAQRTPFYAARAAAPPQPAPPARLAQPAPGLPPPNPRTPPQRGSRGTAGVACRSPQQPPDRTPDVVPASRSSSNPRALPQAPGSARSVRSTPSSTPQSSCAGPQRTLTERNLADHFDPNHPFYAPSHPLSIIAVETYRRYASANLDSEASQRVSLHIYRLKSFAGSVSDRLGLGLYHVSLEVFGLDFHYGYCDDDLTGVMVRSVARNYPELPDLYEHYWSVKLGRVGVVPVEENTDEWVRGESALFMKVGCGGRAILKSTIGFMDGRVVQLRTTGLSLSLSLSCVPCVRDDTSSFPSFGFTRMKISARLFDASDVPVERTDETNKSHSTPTVPLLRTAAVRGFPARRWRATRPFRGACGASRCATWL